MGEHLSNLPYSGKLSREKNFREFRGFVFMREIWGRGVLWHGKSEQSAKVFLAKIYFSPIRESFLPRKFPAIRYFAR